uniref:Makorinlike protein putative n=1 Tax=Albugo laibachii Nc14 TaxID=890382 RepID=F0WK19_9STRA|nr:makorinlike protein putative [Albugo laibachii Nc14]|eukprot:CCA21621.1 makorinlike protein putative [Albugo laibachii Nc14]
MRHSAQHHIDPAESHTLHERVMLQSILGNAFSDDEIFYEALNGEYDIPCSSQQQKPSTDLIPNSTHQMGIPSVLAPPICRFYVLGKCRYESLCTYSHNIGIPGIQPSSDPLDAARLVDCPFFLRGNCKFGEYCRLRHASSRPASYRFRNPAVSKRYNAFSYTCGICLDDIVDSGKRFGLLTGCDHCFCMECLGEWRRSKDLDVEVTRTCPECRQPSFFIVPSITFCKGIEKQHAIVAYKHHLGKRNCKYFDGMFGSCPFGQHCFYAHVDENGHDVKKLDYRKRTSHSHTHHQVFSSLWSSYSQLLSFLRSFGWVEDDDFEWNASVEDRVGTT